MQAQQRLAEPLLRRCAGELPLPPELCDHGAHLRRAKPQLAQAGSDLCRHLGGARGRRRMRPAAVHRHARQDAEMPGIAGAAQLAPMQRAVMGRADRDEIVRAVAAAFGARHDVMQIQEGGVAAARHAAATLIAAQHSAPERRRNVLLRAGAPAAGTSVAHGGAHSGAALVRRALFIGAAARVGTGSGAAVVRRVMFIGKATRVGAGSSESLVRRVFIGSIAHVGAGPGAALGRRISTQRREALRVALGHDDGLNVPLHTIPLGSPLLTTGYP